VTGGEFADRLKARASQTGVDLPDGSLDQLEHYIRLLAKWAATTNLTSLTLEPLADESLDRLLLEPIAAARYVPTGPLTWFDLGSGGGSPALPLKIVRPDVSLVMVEPKGRKVAFLREAIRALRLPDAAVEPVRFQNLGTERHGTAHLVTVRALRVDDELMTTAERLLRIGGRLFLFGAGSTPQLAPGFANHQRISLANSSTLTVRQRVPRGT